MSGTNEIKIIPMEQAHIKDINKTNEAFPIFGRLKPSFVHGQWAYGEELYDSTHYIRFPDDNLNWEDYIDNDDKAIYLAYHEEACVGQIRLIKDLYRYCYIENIAVCQAFRRSGVGGHLFAKAEEWAKEKRLVGISLEAQDDNLAACRFYTGQGMVLGGIDTMKHAFNPNIDITLYWYKKF
jgi:GNAT superfamily N-acetyltransferase